VADERSVAEAITGLEPASRSKRSSATSHRRDPSRGKGVAGSWPVVTIALQDCDRRGDGVATCNGAAGFGRTQQTGAAVDDCRFV